jgi:2,5-diamino-6-(ribosylamino)-4(3H)-pyrimidinone 5'-phosphate reductase
MSKIIMHNQVSLDGAISGFQIDMASYYGIVNSYGAEMYLVGSNTAKSGIYLFSEEIPAETDNDFLKPEPIQNDNRPFWAIPDTEGKLEGLLHVFRRYKHCRDVIVFVSLETPPSYLKYLKDRNYDFIIAGEVKVDFRKAIGELQKLHPFTTMITDNGGSLSAVLFDKGLIDQISLIISPALTDNKNPKLFRELKLGKRIIKLEPTKAEILANKDILLLLDVNK